jgi:hypothetical protein
MANLLAVKHRPLFTMKNVEKMLNKFNLFEVDKSVAYVALKLKVNWKIKEIKLSFEPLVNQL